MEPKLVYVAGPYTHEDVAQNVRRAIGVADILLNNGYFPYVPHLTHFWHLVSPHSHAEWIRLDEVWLAKCDALVRLPGSSPGADHEIRLAQAWQIPVISLRATENVAERLPQYLWTLFNTEKAP